MTDHSRSHMPMVIMNILGECEVSIATISRPEDNCSDVTEGAPAEPSPNPPAAASSTFQLLIIPDRPARLRIPRSIDKENLHPSICFELIAPTSLWWVVSDNANKHRASRKEND